jgi:molybdopterin synthase catalytic subunit
MRNLTNEPIDIAGLFAQMHAPLSGAIVLFSGEVRSQHKGRGVRYLEYEAYLEMADKEIEAILAEARQRWKLNKAICVHRIGRLEISDCAVVVLTAAMHRSESYLANRYIIDEVKRRVAVWKHEFFDDGTSAWGTNDCACASHQPWIDFDRLRDTANM